MSWVRRPEDPTRWELYTFAASVSSSKSRLVYTIPPPDPGYHPSAHDPLFDFLIAGTMTLVAARQCLFRLRRRSGT